MGRWLLMLVLTLGVTWTPTPQPPAGGAGDERPLNEVIWPVGG